jgi:hypothetical protein
MVFLKKLKAIKVKKIYLKEKRGDKNIFLSLKLCLVKTHKKTSGLILGS